LSAESFEQLRLEFLTETEDTLETLQRDLNRLGLAVGRDAPDAEVVDRVFRTTHSLKGVAGMFGLDEMSAVSHAMESVFDQLRDGRLPLDGRVLDLLHRGNESLHELLAHAAGRIPARPASAESVIREIERHLESHVPPIDPSGNADPLVAALPHLDEAARSALEGEAQAGATIVVIQATFGEKGFEQPFRDLLERIRAWGTVHGSVPGDPAGAHEVRIRVVASGARDSFALMRAVGPLGAEVLPCEPALAFGRLSATAGPDAVAAERNPDAGSVPAETLRVPVHRVDRLLAGLGDVIQAKLGLDDTARELVDGTTGRRRNMALAQALRTLDRRIRLLQDEILRVRMVSLGPTFQLLERTVRETSRATGKEARLATSGEHVELDKRVVDSLTEPLVHLVRNAVDHGIEDPATRVRLGKNRLGTVRIDAGPRGGHTVLSVSDDGAGLDLDRIERKARASGFLASGATPTRAEIIDVIFRPGFTVREEATSISGRGVGLDAVRAAVAELGGLLTVDTGLEGTLFRLRIPTSVAIARALGVEVAGQEFFVPLAGVVRVGVVRRAEIENAAGEEVVVRDGRATPVVDLAELLGLAAARSTEDRVPAFFLALADRRLACLVDRLGGQREIVARPLGDPLPAVLGVAGATELGDGRTVLILDPVALFELARRRSSGTAA
jgi:two-component system chemotaxis sensor kinase CheA